MTSGSTALARHAPVAAAALGSVEAAVWADVAAIDLLDLVALAARAVGSLHGMEPLAPPAGSDPQWCGAPDGDWRLLDHLTRDERTILAFAEQCSLDVSAISSDDRSAFLAAAGDAAGTLAAALWVVDFLPRTRTALDALFDQGPWPVPDRDRATTDVWRTLDGFVRAVPQLDALDPVTSELVRLRGARQHNCRLCRSLRSRPALRAGADEAAFAAVDDYRGSLLTPIQQAALAFTDAMLWSPGRLDPEVIGDLRALTEPDVQVELVLDVTRNALNKVAVALGADAPHVEDGVEIYDVGPDGELLYGLTPD
jgi:alkylhydroperoxidase family enzyme